jgi:hypothetical protein
VRHLPFCFLAALISCSAASTVGYVRKSVVVSAIAVGALVVIGGAAFFGIRALTAQSGPECHVPGGTAGLDLDAVQLQHASTISAVGLQRGLPERARIIALATAYQESSMRNLDHGDRDSVGLFQQRPSQGWGTAAQIMDPVYAAGKFYDALDQVDGWQKMSVTDAAQAVQYSGFPDAYAKWEDEATILADELGGSVDPSGSCRSGAQPVTAEQPDRAAVPGAESASPELAAALGALEAELGGVRVLSVSDDGKSATLTVSVPELSAENGARAAAAWAVAHATSMGITAVSTDRRTWSDHEWRDDGSGRPAGQVFISVG